MLSFKVYGSKVHGCDLVFALYIVFLLVVPWCVAVCFPFHVQLYIELYITITGSVSFQMLPTLHMHTTNAPILVSIQEASRWIPADLQRGWWSQLFKDPDQLMLHISALWCVLLKAWVVGACWMSFPFVCGLVCCSLGLSFDSDALWAAQVYELRSHTDATTPAAMMMPAPCTTREPGPSDAAYPCSRIHVVIQSSWFYSSLPWFAVCFVFHFHVVVCVDVLLFAFLSHAFVI